MSDVGYYTSESMAWTQADSTQSSGDLEDSTRHGSLDYQQSKGGCEDTSLLLVYLFLYCSIQFIQTEYFLTIAT